MHSVEAHSVEAYGEAYTRLTQNPGALTTKDVAALGVFDAARAKEAREIIAARTRETNNPKTLARETDDAITAAIDREDFDPFFAVLEKYLLVPNRAAPMLAGIQAQVLGVLAGMRRRFAALEKAIAQQKSLTLADLHRGPWDGSVSYRRGELCARQGSMWLCVKDTVGIPPGSGGPEVSGWTLVVKSGRDAVR